jgi:KUP system potassium uptake protein
MRQVFSGKYLLWLAYQSIGVIYGDIGTSPLYVFSSTFSDEPSYDDLVGVLSIIIVRKIPQAQLTLYCTDSAGPD